MDSRLQIRLPADLRAELDAQAEAEGRSTANLIRLACRRYLDSLEEAKG